MHPMREQLLEWQACCPVQTNKTCMHAGRHAFFQLHCQLLDALQGAVQRVQPGRCAGHTVRALGAGHLPQCERPPAQDLLPKPVCQVPRAAADGCWQLAAHNGGHSHVEVHACVRMSHAAARKSTLQRLPGIRMQAEVEVVTAGSPRVFNPAAAQWYDKSVLSNYRFVNNKDIIPSVPFANSGCGSSRKGK